MAKKKKTLRKNSLYIKLEIKEEYGKTLLCSAALVSVITGF